MSLLYQLIVPKIQHTEDVLVEFCTLTLSPRPPDLHVGDPFWCPRRPWTMSSTNANCRKPHTTPFLSILFLSIAFSNANCQKQGRHRMRNDSQWPAVAITTTGHEESTCRYELVLGVNFPCFHLFGLPSLQSKYLDAQLNSCFSEV